MAFDTRDPNHPNADLEFEGQVDPAEETWDSNSEFGEPVSGGTAARKTTGMPSPYEKRETIVQKQSESGDFQPVVLSSQSGIHAAKPQGFFKTAVDKMFRTKKVSGVIAVGAESITVVKTFKPEEFRIGLQDYVDADED